MKLLSLSIVIILFFVGRGTVTPLPLELLDPNDLIQYSDVSYRCPTGYSQPDNSNWNNCYMLYTDHLSRRDAAARCNAENGTLASVGNAFVNAFIYSLATKSGTTWLWLGIQCFNRTDASCVNDDNTPFVYSNFYPGQPTTSPTSDNNCISMLSDNGKGSQTWATQLCHNQSPFVCQVPAGEYGKTSCLDDWTAYQGMCYKKFYTPSGLTKEDQSLECEEATGGMLATIKSKEMNDFITNLHCGGGTGFRIGLECPNTSKKGDISTCVWDDGTPFSYSNFAAGQPVRSANKYCGYSLNGTWYTDSVCNGPYGFLCAVCQAPMMLN